MPEEYLVEEPNRAFQRPVQGAFSLIPISEREVLISLVEKVDRIEKLANITNGRLSKLERFMWALGGGMVVIGLIIIPLFLDLLRSET